jgi:hypothetical protein
MKAAIIFDIDEDVDLEGAGIEYTLVDKEGNPIPVTKANGVKMLPRRMTYLSCYYGPEVHQCKTKMDAFVEGFNTLLDYLNEDMKVEEEEHES